MSARSLAQGALMAAVTVLLSLLSYYIPELGILTNLLVPLPTIVVCRRFGVRAAALSGAAASLLLLLFMDPLAAFIQAVGILVPGLIIGTAFTKAQRYSVVLVLGYLAYFIVFAAEMFAFQALSGVSFIKEITQQINAAGEATLAVYAGMGLGMEQRAALSAQVSQMTQMMKMLLPAVLLLYPLALAWLVTLISSVVLKRLKLTVPAPVSLTQWRVPPALRVPLLITTLGAALWLNLAGSESTRVYPVTLLTLLMIFYVFMGFSLIVWFIKKRAGKKATGFIVLVVVLCLVFPAALMLVAFAGMMDCTMNVRARFEEKQ